LAAAHDRGGSEEDTVSDTDRGQVSASAAEVYDGFFVPALFEQWTDVVLDAADVRSGHRVLDVGCGTGVLARAALGRVGASGHVAGLDPNDGMLAVARRAEPRIEWQTGRAEQMPFADHSFDCTVSQFALMFFTDPEAGLREVRRVTRPNGRVAIAVWDQLDNNRSYARLAALIEELLGPEAADAIRVPYHMGDPDTLRGLARAAVGDPAVTRHPGVARFESLPEWLHTEIRGWTLADTIDDDGFATLLDAARDQLSDLVEGGRVVFDVSALVISGSTAPPDR
jgi:ubiquinone/menaquinone biosynthesis C-methylase UbiE